MRRLQTFTPKPAQAPPTGEAGVLGWLRRHLFRTWWDGLLTLICVLGLMVFTHWFFDWAVTKAVWEASSRRECLDRSPGGACWAGIVVWAKSFIYGRYPASEHWRINLTVVLALLWVSPMFLKPVTHKLRVLGGLLCLFPCLAGHLMLGGSRGWFMQLALGISVTGFLWSTVHALLCVQAGDRVRLGALNRTVVAAGFAACSLAVTVLLWGWEVPLVKTNRWGGMFLTLVIAAVGVGLSLPGGILLALGRRSRMLLLRALVTAYIELLRSVPLITVLFMAVTMTPLFLPVERNPDKLLLALIGIGMFASAYMAEVVRGGLQAVPLGQLEAARSIGLSYRHTMRWVVLPQALRHMIPNIASSFIGLLKDTTVVAIIGLYDFSLMLRVPGSNPTWIGLHIETFVLGGAVYFAMCYSISRYSRRLERSLDTGAGTR